MYATANFDTKNCVLFGMYSELVRYGKLSTVGGKSFPTRHLLIEFSMRRLLIRMTEHLYPAILIRLTRSTAAAAYDGKVTFKLDKLVFYIDRSNKSADDWLALFSNQPIRQLHSEQR
ncbi:hypothetical protein T02_15459 [Trichinella nativa]|uniref:Uncharacterized protein n=1 Tax=Trichinella nativa TaxID=6335 RepID=A0A0V1LM15_9BILA|nr:hypothetical protein T02_15459 [Trichinella nativa]